MGIERGRGQTRGSRQRIAATSTDDDDFSLFGDQPNQASTSIAATQPGPNDALTAQIAMLNSLLSGLSSIVNKPQGF